MRLIDADAFKKVLSEHEMIHDKRRSFDDYDFGAANAYEHASDLLDEMPTVERPHGEWIDGSQGYFCLECYYIDHFYFEHNFCPNCGADMRKKEGEAK